MGNEDWGEGSAILWGHNPLPLQRGYWARRHLDLWVMKSSTVDLHSRACASLVETLRSNVIPIFELNFLRDYSLLLFVICLRKCTAVWMKWTTKHKNLTTTSDSFVTLKIVNLSLSTGRMPNALKIASLSPSLKKPDADFKQFLNFSNLKLFSKLIEKAAAVQLTDHVKTHHLD